jgi:hypothetical protein
MTTTKTDIQTIVEKSFLSRVPGIMATQPELSLEDAVKVAFDTDESFCYRLMLANESERRGLDKPADAIISNLSDRVYRRLRHDG